MIITSKDNIIILKFETKKIVMCTHKANLCEFEKKIQFSAKIAYFRQKKE